MQEIFQSLQKLNRWNKFLLILLILRIYLDRMLNFPPWIAWAHAAIFWFYVYFTGINAQYPFTAIIAVWAGALATLVTGWSVAALIKTRTLQKT